MNEWKEEIKSQRKKGERVIMGEWKDEIKVKEKKVEG